MDVVDAIVRTAVLAVVCYANIRIASMFINRGVAPSTFWGVIIPMILGVAMYSFELTMVATWQTP